MGHESRAGVKDRKDRDEDDQVVVRCFPERKTAQHNFRLIGGKLCGESKRDYWQKRGFSAVG